MGIYVTLKERLYMLQQENNRLRAIVGEPKQTEKELDDEELNNEKTQETLASRADDMELALDMIAEVLL